MSIRQRIGRLERLAATLPDPGRFDLIVCNSEGTDPEGRPAGQYLCGSVMDYVFTGSDPDPAVLAKLQTRLNPSGLTIVCLPNPLNGP